MTNSQALDRSTTRKVANFVKRYLYALGATGYVFTLGLTARRHRSLIHAIARHFGYADHCHLVPLVRPDAMLTGQSSIHTSSLAGGAESVSLLELTVLNALVAETQPGVLFEIGTFEGRTTLNLALNAPPEARIYTLDLPRADVVSSPVLPITPEDAGAIERPKAEPRFVGTAIADRVVQLYGDSATFDFSPFEGQTDFVFIDGAHSYSYVFNDSCIAIRLLRHGHGTIVWHDYGTSPGVSRALGELRRRDSKFRGLRQVEATTLAYLKL